MNIAISNINLLVFTMILNDSFVFYIIHVYFNKHSIQTCTLNFVKIKINK